jgi:hypothetical protein
MRKALLAAAAVAAVVAGCVSDAGSNRFLRLETADDSYTRIEFPFRSSIMGTYRVPVFTKTLEHEGKVAVCGYFINTGTSCDATLTEEWFKQAAVTFDKKPIGNGRYMQMSKPSPDSKYQARCVATDVPWDVKYGRGLWLEIKGQEIRAFC